MRILSQESLKFFRAAHNQGESLLGIHLIVHQQPDVLENFSGEVIEIIKNEQQIFPRVLLETAEIFTYHIKHIGDVMIRLNLEDAAKAVKKSHSGCTGIPQIEWLEILSREVLFESPQRYALSQSRTSNHEGNTFHFQAVVRVGSGRCNHGSGQRVQIMGGIVCVLLHVGAAHRFEIDFLPLRHLFPDSDDRGAGFLPPLRS